LICYRKWVIFLYCNVSVKILQPHLQQVDENMVKIKLNIYQLIVYDFDGVMTDNKAIVDQYGNESVIVNRSDGLAISKLREIGIQQVIMSTEENEVVQRRAGKLKIHCLNGIKNKLLILKKYLIENNIPNDKVIYFGNDINDLEAMRYIGLPIAPADAHKQIKEISKIVTEKRGGDGVIREFLDMISDDKKM